LREKWWYIDNLKFSKISNLFTDNMVFNKLQYNPNIWLNINFNKLKLNQSKLKKILIQLLQLKRNIIEEYNNNTYKIYSINTINSNNVNNNNNIEENGNNNETINEENSNITEFMQKFINDHIITIDGNKYLKEEENLRKIITTNEEKFNLIWKAHAIGHEGFDKTY